MHIPANPFFFILPHLSSAQQSGTSPQITQLVPAHSQNLSFSPTHPHLFLSVSGTHVASATLWLSHVPHRTRSSTTPAKTSATHPAISPHWQLVSVYPPSLLTSLTNLIAQRQNPANLYILLPFSLTDYIIIIWALAAQSVKRDKKWQIMADIKTRPLDRGLVIKLVYLSGIFKWFTLWMRLENFKFAFD